MSENHKEKTSPPEISPFLFPLILAVMGAWCFYDGWITSDVEMLEHATFNRVASGVLLPWAIIDFIRTRKSEQREKASLAEKEQSDIDSKDETHDT